jgi:Flp pilus assembly pilin Flp
MKNWIMNFIADERGAESTELSVTGIVVAGGAVAGFNTLKGKLDEKNGQLITELDAATSAN